MSQIIPALQSRCTRFRFAPLNDAQALERTQVVAAEEGVRCADNGLEACVRLGNGDMRRCLNVLQSTHMAFGEVTEQKVYQCVGAPLPQARAAPRRASRAPLRRVACAERRTWRCS